MLSDSVPECGRGEDSVRDSELEIPSTASKRKRGLELKKNTDEPLVKKARSDDNCGQVHDASC